MLKEFFQWVVSQTEGIRIHEGADGREYTDNDVSVIQQPKASAIGTSRLSSIVEYIKSTGDTFNGRLMIHIDDFETVRLLDELNVDRLRDSYINVNAPQIDVTFGRFLDLETFNVMLQSAFLETDERSAVLKVAGNVTGENVNSFKDDGVTQTVTARVGIQQGEYLVPNPVALQPYRTFVEVEQPESNFVFRMKENGNKPVAALFEADGGAWKIDAVANIKAYFEEALEDEIKAKNVYIVS